MSERRWRGQWWESDQPDVVVPGTLHYGDDGRLRLELIGGFNTEIRVPLPGGNGYVVSMESRELSLIQGVCNGDRFTLIDAIERSTNVGSDGITTQDISANQALRGVHLASRDERLFTHAVLELGWLLSWSNRSTFYWQSSPGSGPGEKNAATRPVAPVTATYQGMTIDLNVRSSEFGIVGRPSANERAVEARERAVLEFGVAEPVSFTGFNVVSQDMQDLLTLSAYSPCGWIGLWLYFRTSERGFDVEKEVEVLGRRIYQMDTPENEPSHHDFLFTLADLDFPDLVPRWLALKDRARLGFNILLGLRYISRAYLGSKVLGAATAAENIHGALCPKSTRLPQATYEDLRKRVLSAIADDSDEIRSFVNDGLQNRPTYNMRTLELASMADSEAVEDLLTDRAEWATRLKNARNAFAHANERSVQDIDSTSAYWLLEVTYALLCLVAMEKLGLTGEVQRRALSNSKINWAAAQFKKLVT